MKVVAIDGPCGSGKGTIASILSKKYSNIFNMYNFVDNSI